MPYTWTDGELITAKKLNETAKMMVVTITSNSGVRTLDKTWQEIYDALEKNTLVLVKMPNVLGSVSISYEVICGAFYNNLAPLPGQEPSYVVSCATLGEANLTSYTCAEPTSYPSYSTNSDGDGSFS